MTMTMTPVGTLLAQPQPKPLDWLVQGYLLRGTTTLLHGETATGKSLLALDIAASVALGRAWGTCRVRQGPALVLVDRGYSGLQRRLFAWATPGGCLPELEAAPLALSNVGEALNDPRGLQAVVEATDRFTFGHGAPALLVVDILCPGRPALDHLRTSFPGATLLVVHHQEPNALPIAFDSVFRLECDTGGRRTLSCSGVTNAPRPKPRHFALEQVPLPWCGADGEPETSVILQPTDRT